MEENVSVQVISKCEGKIFYANNVEEALKNCQTEGYSAIYMPQVIDNKLQGHSLFRSDFGFDTPSIVATGKTLQGTAVVVYAHVPNYFSNPANIIAAKKQGLVDGGAGIMPQKEFQRLLDLQDDKNVFVVDYGAFLDDSLDVRIFHTEDVLEHPQTIPFFGGRERAEEYFIKRYLHPSHVINVHYPRDLNDKPVGRLLSIGNENEITLYGESALDGAGRFVGVPKIISLEKLL